MKTITTIILSFIFLAMLSSCREKHYSYYIENASPYSIDSARLNGDHYFKLKPYEIAGPFEVVTRDNLANAFARPTFSIFIPKFSDADTTYYYRYGSGYPCDMIEDNKTYIVHLETIPNDTPKVRFIMHLIEGEPEKVAGR